MHLQEVISQKDKKLFLELPKRLYRDDPNWVCPLDIEIESIFNPATNTKFRNGEAVRWLLYDKKNVVGRIAVFIDRDALDHHKVPTGGCGFFECVENKSAAFMLFDAAKKWLKEKGMEAMIGPVNFGENFHHWGLLTEGFARQAYYLPYNFPYYQHFFEDYGFKDYFKQFAYLKKLSDGFPERALKFAEFTESRPGYSFEHFSYKRIDEFVDYFVDVYNTIWEAYYENYSPLLKEDIKTLLINSKAVLDEEMIWFAFDKSKPVGFLIVMPDINQVLIKLKNGKLNLINKLKFAYYKRHSITRCRAFVAGIYPEYRNTGIISALFYQLIKILKDKPRQEEIELSWVGDYNPKMIGIYDKMGGKQINTHITYMHLFDPTVPFERFNNEFDNKKY